MISGKLLLRGSWKVKSGKKASQLEILLEQQPQKWTKSGLKRSEHTHMVADIPSRCKRVD